MAMVSHLICAMPREINPPGGHLKVKVKENTGLDLMMPP
jgi:hypothetical protein